MTPQIDLSLSVIMPRVECLQNEFFSRKSFSFGLWLAKIDLVGVRDKRKVASAEVSPKKLPMANTFYLTVKLEGTTSCEKVELKKEETLVTAVQQVTKVVKYQITLTQPGILNLLHLQGIVAAQHSHCQEKGSSLAQLVRIKAACV